MRHELRERYDRKLCHFLEQRRTDRLRSVQRDDGHRRRDYSKRREDEQRPHNLRGKKGPPPRENKGFKPCHVHSEYAKHSYKECRANPRNRVNKASHNNNNNMPAPAMRATTTMTLATQAATTSHGGVTTLPCPAMERSPAR